MKRLILLGAAAALALPVRGETFYVEGSSSAEVVVKREGEFCETGAADKCQAGQPCFINVFIRGEPAKALYEALKLHGTKKWDGFELEYTSTRSNRLTCYGSQNKGYYCSFGYDGVSNQLSDVKACRYH
jgi:hypothetical protein